MATDSCARDAGSRADDGPAVQLERSSGHSGDAGGDAGGDEWSTLQAHLDALPTGKRLTLSARVESLGADQEIWLGAWAYANNAELTAWKELDHWQVRRALTLGSWRDVSLTFTLPPATICVDLRLTANTGAPLLAADVHLRPAVRGVAAPAGDTIADLSAVDLQRMVLRSRAAVTGIRQAAFAEPPLVRVIDRTGMQAYVARTVAPLTRRFPASSRRCVSSDSGPPTWSCRTRRPTRSGR